MLTRTQVQLTPKQLEVLRKLASNRNQSIAELIRQSVDLFITRQSSGEGNERSERWRRARAVSGRFRSGLPDLSLNHDRYFADDSVDYPRRNVKRPT